MIQLNFGETPWDNLSRQELLLTVWRMYDVLTSLTSIAHLAGPEPKHPFWSPNGTGGNALERAHQVLGPIHEEHDEEEIYRAFFRGAKVLLFEHRPGFELGIEWLICDVCGQGVGSSQQHKAGDLCSTISTSPPGCAGTLRAIAWKDVRPHDHEELEKALAPNDDQP